MEQRRQPVQGSYDGCALAIHNAQWGQKRRRGWPLDCRGAPVAERAGLGELDSSWGDGRQDKAGLPRNVFIPEETDCRASVTPKKSKEELRTEARAGRGLGAGDKVNQSVH